ncbi:MAG: hypothetical protein ACXVP4_08025 [Bacteroidia bacterium]
MKFKLLLFFSGIILFIYSSCSSPNKEKDQAAVSDSLKLKSTTSAPLDSQTLEVDKPAIVFLWPDDNEMEKLKAKDSDAFYTTVDDYTFYSSQTMELADSLTIKSFSTNKKNIDFKTADNKHFVIDRSKLKEDDAAWGIYLFNGVDTPKISGDIELNKAFLKTFFKK